MSASCLLLTDLANVWALDKCLTTADAAAAPNAFVSTKPITCQSGATQAATATRECD